MATIQKRRSMRLINQELKKFEKVKIRHEELKREWNEVDERYRDVKDIIEMYFDLWKKEVYVHSSESKYLMELIKEWQTELDNLIKEKDDIIEKMRINLL